MPLARELSEPVSLDLKEIESSLVLHIINHATRYSAACVIPSKKRDVVIAAVLRIWVATFGAPRQMLSDNGGEFSNDDFRKMGEKLNITIKSTAAESPWSNGINERHNAILADMVMKIKDDTNCSYIYKECPENVYGYSPNQLVFGKNPHFPSVLCDKLPPLDQISSSKILLEFECFTFSTPGIHLCRIK